MRLLGAALALLAFGSLLCQAAPFPPWVPSFPPSLQIFPNRLRMPGMLIPQQYHFAVDLRSHDLHRELTSYLFKGGSNFNPHVLYLGTDPTKPWQHLAVAYFSPDIRLASRIHPAGTSSRIYEGRHGLLAMRLSSYEEPEFVGVLWLKNNRAAAKMKNVIEQNDLDGLERNRAIDLTDIQRVMHYGPV